MRIIERVCSWFTKPPTTEEPIAASELDSASDAFLDQLNKAALADAAKAASVKTVAGASKNALNISGSADDSEVRRARFPLTIIAPLRVILICSAPRSRRLASAANADLRFFVLLGSTRYQRVTD